MRRVQTWLRDPTTINGLGAAVGVVAGALAHALTGSLGWAQMLGISAAALVHVLLPSGGAGASVETLVQDTARAVFERHLAQAMPGLLADTAGALTQTAAALAPSSASGPASPSPSPSSPSGASS